MGRKPFIVETKPFVFPGSEIEVQVRKVPQQVIQDANASLKPPVPPMQEVELDGKTRMEPNYTHPDYLQALEDHQMAQMRLSQRILIRMGIVHELTDEDRAATKAVLDTMRELNIEPTAGSELEQWVYYVAAPTMNDLTALMQEVLGLSVPTPKSD